MAARASSTIALCTLTLLGLLAPGAPIAGAAELEVAPPEASESAVGFVVVRENGSGSAAQAQSYLDALLASVAKRNGWSGATGKYFTKRRKAKKYIEETKPSFGFLSFGAYLALRKVHGLVPLAVADASASGGAQYFVISKNHFTIDGCKGKSLASNHTGDASFIDNVVSADAFDLGDFEVVETRRPVQTIKAVINDEAECALIDDSQIAAMTMVDGGGALRPVWASKSLPAVVMVAFDSASAEQRESYAKTLGSICDDEGRAACDAAGLEVPRKVEANVFEADEAAYEG